MYDRIEINYFGVDPKDIGRIVDEIDEQEFFAVRTERHPPPPMASPLFEDWTTILIIISIAAHGFLDDLGKDAYQALRRAIVRAAHKGWALTKRRGGGNTFGIKVHRENAYVVFLFREAPTEEQLGTALTALPAVLDAVPVDQFAQVHFDAQANAWSVPLPPQPRIAKHLADFYTRRSTQDSQSQQSSP